MRGGGYNLDALAPGGGPANLAHLRVGSEATLAISTAIEIRLTPLPPKNRVRGICHFPTFDAAMEAAQHQVRLKPTRVELVDRTMLNLAREIPIFVPTLARFVRSDPAAFLIVEFAETPEDNDRNLQDLRDTMADLVLGFGTGVTKDGDVVEARDPSLIADIGELCKSGLNIMTSMKEAGKPPVPAGDAAGFLLR